MNFFKNKIDKKKKGENTFLRNVWEVFLLALSIAFIILFAAIIIGTGVFAAKYRPELEEYRKDAKAQLEQLENNNFEYLKDSEIYDIHGNLIGKASSTGYEYIPYEDISPELVKGYVAVEDRRFYIHNGIDYKGIARAAVSLVKNRGKVTQGGSTITQQVLKNNVIGTKENKFKRKIKEITMAGDFEEMFDKDKIMEFYVNTNFYGNQCYGIESASKYYFGKSAKDLDIHESAFFVGLSNAPSKYNPRTNPEESRAKTNEVLKKFWEQGLIVKEEYERLMMEPLEFAYQRDNSGMSNSLVNYSIEEAVKVMIKSKGLTYDESLGNAKNNLTHSDYEKLYQNYLEIIKAGGYKIHTTLDLERQKTFQEIFNNQFKGFDTIGENGKFELQGSAVLVNNKTGAAEVIIGGRNEDDEYNRGFRATRQPGSAIKPLIAYAPAFETGEYFPSRVLTDKEVPPITINGEEYSPKNAYRGYLGNMPMREALARSTNTIVYTLVEDLGTENVIKYLEKMKFTSITPEDYTNKSISLGGFTYGATPLEMAKGFSTLANGGRYVDNKIISKIEYQYDPNAKLSIATRNTIEEYLEEINEILEKYEVKEDGNKKSEKKNKKNKPKDNIFNKTSKEEENIDDKPKMDDAYTINVIELNQETGYLTEKASEKLSTQVFSPETSYLTLSSMMDSVSKPYGTSKRVNIKKNIDIAGKTGTTNGQKDAWFVGITPDYTLCVWVGYDQPKSLGFYGGDKPVQIYNALTNSMLDSLTTKEFTKPETVDYRNVDSMGLPVDQKTGKVDLFNLTQLEDFKEHMEKIQEEIDRTKEEDLVISIKNEIEEFEELINSIQTPGDEQVSQATDMVESLRSKINSLQYSDEKDELSSRLETIWESKSDVINIRLEEMKIEKKKLAEQDKIQELKDYKNKIIGLGRKGISREKATEELNSILSTGIEFITEDGEREYKALVDELKNLVSLLESDLQVNSNEDLSGRENNPDTDVTDLGERDAFDRPAPTTPVDPNPPTESNTGSGSGGYIDENYVDEDGNDRNTAEIVDLEEDNRDYEEPIDNDDPGI